MADATPCAHCGGTGKCKHWGKVGAEQEGPCAVCSPLFVDPRGMPYTTDNLGLYIREEDAKQVEQALHNASEALQQQAAVLLSPTLWKEVLRRWKRAEEPCGDDW